MSQTIHISEKSASLLAQQAAAHGLSLEAWIEELASEKALSGGTTRHSKTRAAAEGILELQKQVKPDPEEWTVRDYIDYGRRQKMAKLVIDASLAAAWCFPDEHSDYTNGILQTARLCFTLKREQDEGTRS